jgi:predicted SAM-dependent methyltransferase
MYQLKPLLLPSLRIARRAGTSVMDAIATRRARARLRDFSKPYKLNVGCGSVRFEGWVNLDENPRLPTVDLVWDLRRGLPVADGSCELIYCEHLLEHLRVEDGLRFLRACWRALRVGGLLRVAMPSLDFLLEQATPERWRDQDWLKWSKLGSTVQTRAEMLNVAFRAWGHQYLYDREELHRRLGESGFTNIVDCQRGESDHPDLQNRETRKDSLLICEVRRSD